MTSSTTTTSPSSSVINDGEEGGVLLNDSSSTVTTTTKTTTQQQQQQQQNDDDDDFLSYSFRFASVARLYFNQQKKDKNTTIEMILNRLYHSHVIIIGLGGVGSWAAESLCRSGIGMLTIIDLDDICISNTNRQIHTTMNTIGKLKTTIMKQRLELINPNIHVNIINDFVNPKNVKDILQQAQQKQSKQQHLSACLDAMDQGISKAALISACVDIQLPIVTCGASAGKMDSTQFRIEDLTRVESDKLLRSCRTLLRREYNFAQGKTYKETKKGKVRKWRISAVYSREQQQEPPSVQEEEPTVSSSSFRVCDGALGTACFVTGSQGFLAASKVVEMIAKDEYLIPRRG